MLQATQTDPKLSAGLSGVALDELTEGVRMIAAGLNDLGGAIHELDKDDKDTCKPKLSTVPHENLMRSPNARAK